MPRKTSVWLIVVLFVCHMPVNGTSSNDVSPMTVTPYKTTIQTIVDEPMTPGTHYCIWYPTPPISVWVENPAYPNTLRDSSNACPQEYVAVQVGLESATYGAGIALNVNKDPMKVLVRLYYVVWVKCCPVAPVWVPYNWAPTKH